MAAKPKPEVKYRARCAECGVLLPLYRGFTDGRVYDHKKDGYRCESCEAKPKPPPPPTRQEVMLANLNDVQHALEVEKSISINEAFGVVLQNMKAVVTGDQVERWVRAQSGEGFKIG